MCNPDLINTFLQLCGMFLQLQSFNIDVDACVKAYDVCVDRQINFTKEINERKDLAVNICEDELFNRKLFSEYYTDHSCMISINY